VFKVLISIKFRSVLSVMPKAKQ